MAGDKISEKNWQAEQDAYTLAAADEILSDNKRLNAAKKAATKMVKEQAARLESLFKIAGKDDTKGMKVLGKAN